VSRIISATLLVTLLSVVAAVDDPKKPYYYPLAKGDKWQYRFTIGEKTSDLVTETIEVEVKGDKVFAKSESRLNGKVNVEEHAVDDKGVYRVGFAGLKFQPTVTLLKYPIKKGETWTEKVKLGETESEVKCTIQGVVTVEVPAGKYRVVQADVTIKVNGQEITGTNWYADNVGIVKQIFTEKGVSATMELKKFSAGK
jgi:hypothetical protein